MQGSAGGMHRHFASGLSRLSPLAFSQAPSNALGNHAIYHAVRYIGVHDEIAFHAGCHPGSATQTAHMNLHQYQNMIRNFCKAHGLDNAQVLIDTGAIHLGGMDMLLRYDESMHPDILRLHLDLGEPPSGMREKLWGMLLTGNFMMGEHTGNHVVFSVHPDSGHIILTLHAHLMEDSPEFLLRLLNEASAEGQKMWRQTLHALAESRRKYMTRARSGLPLHG
jgi:hypothetical protein